MPKRTSRWSTEDVLQLLQTKAVYEQILRDALASLQNPLRSLVSQNSAERQLEHRARHLSKTCSWILSDHDRGPFSFLRCCEVLSLDATAVRDRMRRAGHLDEPHERLVKASKGNARLQRAA